MQAIVTKFHAPTNTKGSRYSAQSYGVKVYVHADHVLNPEQNHIAACRKLCLKIADKCLKDYGADLAKSPWLKPMVTGQIHSGEYVHVFLPNEASE